MNENITLELVQNTLRGLIQNGAWKKFYLDHMGRVGRLEYWVGALPLFLANMVINTVAASVFGSFTLAFLLSLPVVALGIIVQIKRLHDLDQPGWWAAAAVVPGLNFLLFVALGFLAGTPGSNRFGEPRSGVPNY